MLNPMDLQGRTILVTGASSGIGRQTAVLLSQLGGHVLLVARSKERLKETFDLLEGGGHLVESFDLNQVDDIPRWLSSLATSTGPLDGLVHSAGIHNAYPLRSLNSDTIERVTRLNVTAGVMLAKAFRRRRNHNPTSSCIVFISSVVGLVGQPGIVAYASSKGAITAITKSLAIELASQNIRVNCVAPGMVGTTMTDAFFRKLAPEQISEIEAMHPLGLGEASDIANAIAFLLADTGRWITGSTLVIDGGYTAR